MFRNYHVVIFKDREGGFRNLSVRGGIFIILILLLAALAGLNFWLWGFYHQVEKLDKELVEARRIAMDADNQLLSLAGKIQTIEKDLYRIKQFDAKLRVLMNIEGTSAYDEMEGEQIPLVSSNLTNPGFLAQHRELFSRKMHSLIDDMSGTVHLEEVSQQQLVSFVAENRDAMLSTPSIWPTKGYLTSSFGYRTNPVTGRGSMHKGLDISNRPGTPVVAPARGAITFSGPDKAYGICVVIDHGNGISTRYAHLSKTLVEVGQYVQRNEVIAALGNTGRSTGPHLHYEVMVNGVHVDPMRYIMD